MIPKKISNKIVFDDNTVTQYVILTITANPYLILRLEYIIQSHFRVSLSFIVYVHILNSSCDSESRRGIKSLEQILYMNKSEI